LFRQTGTAHIIAISGLHIGLIALFGILVGRLVFMLVTFQRVNRQFYEVLFAFSFALIYTFLAGFSISTIRALIMLSVFLLSYLNKIPMSRWNSWAIALIIILLLDPLNVLDEGFWLSFAAVAILIFAFSGKKQDFNKLLSFIKAQLILLIGLMPLSILIFGNINLQTPLSNFIVLPIASFLLIPLIFLSLLISVFSKSLAQHLFNLSEVVSNYFFIILDKLNEINYLSISINSSIMTFFIVTFVSITLLLPRLFRWKYLVILLFLPIYFKPIKKLEYDEFKVNVLDVGQGLSMVIETKNHVLIYDTGAKFESGFSMANSVVVPFLNKSQIQKVDRLILSHDDNDHSGGMEVLSNYFNDIEIYTVNDDFKTCDSNLSWAWDGVKFEVFSPYQIIPYLGNNSSCVLKISNLKTSILLTGDIEEPVEYRLIHNNLIDIQSDVLIVPHHGSRTSSSIEFIQKVNPKVAINSSGFANQFNHPHPLIKQRYMDEGIDFIDTQTSGNIQISFKNSNFNITEYKKSNNKIWFNNPQKTSKVLKYFHERLE
jgi:competence protein ComEC